MPALAIFAPSSTRNFDLGGVNGNELYAEPMHKEIHFTARHFASPSLQHNGGFQSICRGQQTGSILANMFKETLPFGFTQKDR